MSRIKGISTQTQNVVYDHNPYEGFAMLKEAGFNSCDFSLNAYLKNTELYRGCRNGFFDRSVEELESFFAPHKEAAEAAGISIHQMHMPYPIYIPGGDAGLNGYLLRQVAVKSMEVCRFLECPYMVVHGFKCARELGSEELEWQKTAGFLDVLMPYAEEAGITVCIENLYHAHAGRLVEGPCCDADKAVKRIDAYNQKYGAEVLGFCFDAGHANLVGLDFEEFLTTLGHRLKVLHLHDNDGRADLHQIPYTFTRTRENSASTDWSGLLRGLKTIGFAGTLSFETAPVLSAFPSQLKQEALHLIASIGACWQKELQEEEGERNEGV